MRIEGVRWSAVAEDPPIDYGERIVVIEEFDNMKLKVKPASDEMAV